MREWHGADIVMFLFSVFTDDRKKIWEQEYNQAVEYQADQENVETDPVYAFEGWLLARICIVWRSNALLMHLTSRWELAMDKTLAKESKTVY